MSRLIFDECCFSGLLGERAFGGAGSAIHESNGVHQRVYKASLDIVNSLAALIRPLLSACRSR